MNTYYNARIMFENVKNAFNLHVPIYNYGLVWSLYYIHLYYVDHYHFTTRYFKFYLHSSIEHGFQVLQINMYTHKLTYTYITYIYTQYTYCVNQHI